MTKATEVHFFHRSTALITIMACQSQVSQSNDVEIDKPRATNLVPFFLKDVQTCLPPKVIYSQKYLFLFVWDNTRSVWLAMLGGAVGLRILGLVRNRGFIFMLALCISAFLIGLYITATYTLMGQHNCLLYRDLEIVQQPVVSFSVGGNPF